MRVISIGHEACLKDSVDDKNGGFDEGDVEFGAATLGVFELARSFVVFVCGEKRRFAF